MTMLVIATICAGFVFISALATLARGKERSFEGVVALIIIAVPFAYLLTVLTSTILAN